MRVAVYCRVSTEEQAESKTIENQVEFAKGYCQLNQMEIYNFYLDEGISGTIPLQERPAGRQLLSDAEKKHFEAVYVYRLDRLARTTLDILNTHEKLSKLGISLKSMTESFDTSTPSGKFFMTTLGGIAEIERDTIAERMRLGKNRAIKEGRWPGGPPPYGYMIINKKLVINEKEAEVVRLIFRMYVKEDMDTVSLADYLTAAGFPSPAAARKKLTTGNIWYGSKVWGILTNPVYRGKFIYGKNNPPELREEVNCPAIVDCQQWERAQQKLKFNRFNARRNTKYYYLLRGLIRCGACGRNYCGDGSHSKGRYHYYRCTGTSSFRGKLVEKCSSKYVRADILDEIVLNDIVRFITGSDKMIKELHNKMLARSEHQSRDCEIISLKNAVRKKEQERLRVLSLFRKGMINENEIKLQLQDTSRELQLLQNRIKQIRASSNNKPKDDNFPNLKELLRKKIISADIGLKRELVCSLVESIVVNTIVENGVVRPQVIINYYYSE
ncbi:MAG: recombinase family protein [Desulfotomaculum sp.]|nr:recombinase family protein [Desulfotomaculum sp.]